MNIDTLVRQATGLLAKADIPTARLDAEVLLAHAEEQTRSWIIAHSSDLIDPQTENTFNDLINKRIKRIPVAYLTGHKEFYGRDFIVTPDVLIPRPESETIIDLAKRYLSGKIGKGLDIGTGSGALGISLSLELPEINMTLSDISDEALLIAKKNADVLGAKIEHFVKSDLFDSLDDQQFDLIVANLPYVDQAWERSPETNHEPSLALFADDNGLEIIKKCIRLVQRSLHDNGYLMLESDPAQQADIIRTAATQSGLAHVETAGYITVFRRD